MNATKKVKSLLVKAVIEIPHTYKVLLTKIMKLQFKRIPLWNNSQRNQIVYFAHKRG